MMRKRSSTFQAGLIVDSARGSEQKVSEARRSLRRGVHKIIAHMRLQRVETRLHIEEQLYSNMREARKSAWRKRLRSTGSLLAIGFVVWVLSLVYLLIGLLGRLPDALPSIFTVNVVQPPSMILILFSILPTDTQLIRWLVAISLFLCVWCSATIALVGVAFMEDWIHVHGLLACPAGDVYQPSCVAALAFCSGWFAVILNIGVFGMGPLLARAHGSPPICSRAALVRIQQQRRAFRARHGDCTFYTMHALGIGFVPAFWLAPSGYYAVDKREALTQYWVLFRAFWAAGGVVLAATAVIVICGSAYTGERLDRRTSDDALGLLAWAASAIVLGGILPTEHNRRRLLAAHVERSCTDRDRAAAVIAAMVGSSADHWRQSLLTASSSFRALPWPAANHARHWTTSEDTGLHPKTVPCELGMVDAFISHSWRDDGHLKHLALRQWAADFERDNGRPPRVFLDKACIDQQAIDESLAALPVYLAGCRRIVVCFGHTYSQRLWTLMELFVFCKMRGSMEDVVVLPIGDIDHRTSMAAFDASKAQCYNVVDRERLLSIIEAGFGGFDEFNGLVRRMVTSAWPAAPPTSEQDAERLARQSELRPRAFSTRRAEGYGAYELL